MASAKVTELVKKQIEFYFSDSNFRKDKFLRSTAEENSEGYVPISVLLTFNRLKALTNDITVVAECLKGSDSVEVSEDGTKLRRSTELPATDDSMARTLYVKGYPSEDTEVTIESVTERFSEFGDVLLVKLRKDTRTKKFKGSVFVEFSKEDSVSKAVTAAYEDGIVKMCYKDMPFDCVMSYNEWRARKDAKSKKRKSDGPVDCTDAVPEKVEYTPGLILIVKNIPADATLYELKDMLKAIADVKFVDHNTESTEAYVRCANVEACAKLQEVLSAGKSLREHSVKVDGDTSTDTHLQYVLLEGNEEEAYWQKIAKNAKSNRGKGGRDGGRGRGKGGRGGYSSNKRSKN